MSNATPKSNKEYTNLSHNIRFLRKNSGLSQEELAQSLNIKRSNIAAYESKNVEPRLSVVLDIANFFEIKLETLIKEKLDNLDFKKNHAEDKLLRSSDNTLEIDSAEQLEEFVSKTIKIRKVLEGFKAFYDFKKENLKADFENKDKLLFDIDNFLQLMEHLLSYNETVSRAISQTRISNSPE